MINAIRTSLPDLSLFSLVGGKGKRELLVMENELLEAIDECIETIQGENK